MHVLLSYNCVLTVVKYTDMLCYVNFTWTEVIYAAESHKEIIPLTVEQHFKPHGWLKFHMSDKLRLDFSSDDIFHDSMKRLLDMLRKIFSKTAAREFVCC